MFPSYKLPSPAFIFVFLLPGLMLFVGFSRGQEFRIFLTLAGSFFLTSDRNVSLRAQCQSFKQFDCMNSVKWRRENKATPSNSIDSLALGYIERIFTKKNGLWIIINRTRWMLASNCRFSFRFYLRASNVKPQCVFIRNQCFLIFICESISQLVWSNTSPLTVQNHVCILSSFFRTGRRSSAIERQLYERHE